MEFDENTLKKLTAENDSVLREKIIQTAMAAGAGKSQAEKLTVDMNKVRQVLSAIKPSDLSGIISAVGEDKFKDILNGVYKPEDKK